MTFEPHLDSQAEHEVVRRCKEWCLGGWRKSGSSPKRVALHGRSEHGHFAHILH
jgi:hypothetical protein